MTVLNLGTRGSALALWQAHQVAAEIRTHSDYDCELVIIKTTGDRLADVSLSTVDSARERAGGHMPENTALMEIHTMKAHPRSSLAKGLNPPSPW